MKKTVLLSLCILLLFSSACTAKNAELSKNSASPSESKSEEGIILVPGNPSPGASGSPSGSESASPSASESKKSSLYDPSIFVIQASGTWRQELAKGYYADYECDIYLHKIDANDNRKVTGAYQGIFWMNVKLDADDYLKDLLKTVPVEMTFGGGGEAVCDNFGIFLNSEDDKAWVNYNINGEDGKPLPLTQDTPVAKGSFTSVSKVVYLQAKGHGAQGEKLDYSDVKEGEQFDMNYIVHVQPDSMESGTEREVIFFVSSPDGGSAMVKGKLKRLPGYPEDVSKYLNSKEYEDAAKKHLE